MNTNQIIFIISILSLLITFYIFFKLNKNNDIVNKEIITINKNIQDLNKIIMLKNKKDSIPPNIPDKLNGSNSYSLKEDYDNYVKHNYNELNPLLEPSESSEPLTDNIKNEINNIIFENNGTTEKHTTTMEYIGDVIEQSENIPGDMGELGEDMGELGEDIDNVETMEDMGDVETMEDMGELGEDMGDVETMEDMGELGEDMGELGEDMGELGEDMGEDMNKPKPDNNTLWYIKTESTDQSNKTELDIKNTMDNCIKDLEIKMINNNDIENIINEEITELNSIKKNELDLELEFSNNNSNNLQQINSLEEINKLTLKELQNIARKNKIKIKGKKEELLERVKALFNLHNTLNK